MREKNPYTLPLAKRPNRLEALNHRLEAVDIEKLSWLAMLLIIWAFLAK